MFSDSKKITSDKSVHPPHLIDLENRLTPAALIPFCAYQTNMTLLGQTRKDIPFVVCSQFQPSVLEGQLCYSLKLDKQIWRKSGAGLKNGLILIIDPRKLRMGLEIQNKKEGNDAMINSLNLESINTDQDNARIFIHTLSGFSDFRAGSYAMSALKLMTATDNFKDLLFEKRKCQIENFETCHVTKYIEKVSEKCDCVPWVLSSALDVQVCFTFI